MSEYKAGTFSGDKWQRCHTITFVDTYNSPPQALFHEEEVFVVGGTEVMRRSVGMCSLELSAGMGDIPLRNPATGDLTGASITRQNLYTALYSLYRMAAAARDGG